MTDMKHQRLATRLHTSLQGLDDSAILRCFDLTLWFGSRYASAYELRGSIHLVLDNSLVYAFKDRQTNAKRAVDALAFETPADLFERQRAIVADEVFLTRFLDEIDKADWRIDLRAPIGLKIPMSEA